MRSNGNGRLPAYLAAIITASFSLSGCPAGSGEGLDENGRPLSESDDDGAAPPAASSFARLQQDIFTPLCTVCHAGASAPVGLRLDAGSSFAALVGVPSVQAPATLRVAPGDADNSYLVQKIEGTAAVGGRMPLGGAPVPADLVAALRSWIDAGALPDSTSGDGPVTPIVAATVPAADSTLNVAPLSIAVVFNAPMDFSLLTTQTVVLVASGGDGVFDDGTDVVITPAALTPTSAQAFLIDLTGIALADDDYRLTLAGSGALALASLEGVILDGDADGTPGGDYVAGFTLSTAAPQASWRWLQDNVFTPVCTQCHAAGGIAEFLLLDEASSFASLVDRASSQVPGLLLVAPGDSDNSYLVRKVEGTASVGGRMPLGLPPLDDDTIAAMRAWIDGGALLEPGDPMPDVTTPQVQLTAPGSVLTGSVTIGVAAIDDVGVVEVSLFIDGELFATDGEAPYDFVVDTATFADGLYTLRAEARDAAGNTGVTDDLQVTFDNGPPPDTEAPQASIAPLVSPLSGTVTVTVDATDNVGVASVSLRVDGALLGTDTAAPFMFEWDTRSVANGDRVLQAEASDAAGNTGQSAQVVVTVDNAPAADETPPLVSIDVPAGPLAGIVTIGVEASDTSGVDQVSLFADGVLVATLQAAPYDFSWNVDALADGNHLLTAEALDLAGNTGYADPQVAEVATGLPQATLPWIQDNVFTPTCSGCHRQGGPAAFLWLTDGDSFSQLVNVATDDDGSPFRVLPFNADESSLVERLEGTVTPAMPLGGGPLDAAVIAAVRGWIDGGALETPADDIAPAVVLRLPASPASGTVTLRAVAVDDEAVTTVRFLVDGAVVGTDSVAPFELAFDTTGVADGMRSVVAEAEDAAGNSASSAALELLVDNGG